MINGVHFLLYSNQPEADRAFLRDVLGFGSVDAGQGWLIFALPPAELAVHPASGTFVLRHADQDLLGAVLYLMCMAPARARNHLEPMYSYLVRRIAEDADMTLESFLAG